MSRAHKITMKLKPDAHGLAKEGSKWTNQKITEFVETSIQERCERLGIYKRRIPPMFVAEAHV